MIGSRRIASVSRMPRCTPEPDAIGVIEGESCPLAVATRVTTLQMMVSGIGAQCLAMPRPAAGNRLWERGTAGVVLRVLQYRPWLRPMRLGDGAEQVDPLPYGAHAADDRRCHCFPERDGFAIRG
jgi:hypothetical protein